MNFTTLIGLIGSVVVLGTALFIELKNIWFFLNPLAILIVLGGTCTATLVCFPFKQLTGLVWVFLRRLVGKARHNYMGIVAEIVVLSQAARRGRKFYEAAMSTLVHPFLKDSANVTFWVESEVTLEELRKLLETRAETHFTRYSSQAKIFKTIAKFPPAFGLMGTTIGMISMLQSLDSANAQQGIGPAMAVALVATLWGIIFANLVFVPIAENLLKQTEDDLVARRMIVESVLLIAAGKPSKYVEEMARSFLLPSERGEDAAKEGPGSPDSRKAA